jgi:EpsI family protein
VFVGAAAAAIMAIGASQIVTDDTLIIPDRKAFAGVPREFAGWFTDVRPIDPSVAEVLGADDSIVVNMRSPEGDDYNLYFAYLNAQRDGRSWHSPRQCIPGGGWKIVRQEVVNS